MEDRVADVLVERAAIDNGAAVGLILSLLLHGGLTGLAVYAAMHAEAPRMASVLNIKFAPIPRSAGVMTPATAKPAEKPKPVTPKIEPPRPEPVKTTTAKTPAEKNTVPLSPFGKSTKRGSENPVIPPKPQPSAAPTAPGVAGVGDVAVGSAGVTGLEGGDFPYTIYIERMKNLIGTHWFRPQVATGAATTVYFAIDRDGTIRDAKTETYSGNSPFDRAALRAVLETSPLPPLPFGYNGTYLGVHLTFR